MLFQSEMSQSVSFEAALQQTMHERNKGDTLCVGFPPWRRSYIAAFLYSPFGRVRFAAELDIKSLPAKAIQRVVFWGGDVSQERRNSLLQRGIEVCCAEDGFLRSVGLGKYYVPPLSLVFDRSGIYYDPRQPSDLERLLSETVFSAQECERAQRLTENIIAANISKYNVGAQPLSNEQAAELANSDNVILVPGQVQQDASIKLGCEAINSDEKLVAAVRENCPQALLVYKPHPDTVSGNSGEALSQRACELADIVLSEVPITECLQFADEVHTMTSLVGFEGLLREKKVVVYGRPFYAGWGLTEDKLTIPSRQRQLSLAELVVGVLIQYPRYIDYQTGFFQTPEQALALLTTSRNSAPQRALASSKAYRLIIKSVNLLRSYCYGMKLRLRLKCRSRSRML